MTSPFLAQSASGHGGRGYTAPWDSEKTRLPSVTTVLGAVAKPALADWAASQVAGYAVTHIDELLNRDETAGFHFLRYVWNTPASWEPLDDDNLRFAHRRVLDDASELGTRMHSYIEADLNNWELPPILSFEMQEMVTEWEKFKSDHWIELLRSEATLFHRGARGVGYAGTADGFLHIDGIPTLWDVKTSRGVWDEAWAQIAALGACDEMAVPTSNDDPEGHRHVRKAPDDWAEFYVQSGGAELGWGSDPDEKGQVTTYWKSEPVPAFSQYRILHLRPSDTNNKGDYMAPFCRMLEPPSLDLDPFYDLFLGALDIKKAQRRIKSLKREKEEA